MRPVRMIVYSDYLCPWCYAGAVRMRALEAEFGDRLVVEWRSFLLRPQPDPGRTLEKFRAYTRSWQRVAAEEPGAELRVWASDEGPPSHSVPPHLAAKAAAAVSAEGFARMHERLLRAYFTENRDITRLDTLRALWRESGLPDADFARSEDPELLKRVIDEHNEALECGATGVPAFRMEGVDAVITGAQPVELFRRWIGRALEAQAD